MATNYEPCSICEEYIEGVACTKDQCPVAKMKAENERLEKRLEEEKHALFEQQAYTAKLQAEIDMLTKRLETVQAAKCVYSFDGETVEFCVQSPCPICKTTNQIRAEAIKEFAERLKYHAYDIVLYGEIVTVSRIERTMHEMMTEGEDGNL